MPPFPLIIFNCSTDTSKRPATAFVTPTGRACPSRCRGQPAIFRIRSKRVSVTVIIWVRFFDNPNSKTPAFLHPRFAGHPGLRRRDDRRSRMAPERPGGIDRPLASGGAPSISIGNVSRNMFGPDVGSSLLQPTTFPVASSH